MFEAGVRLLFILLLLRSFQAILGFFGLVGGGVSIHGTHVVNTVCPLNPEVSDEEITLQLLLVLLREPFEFFLPSTHGTTCLYFGFITNMRGGEVLYCKVGDPITEIVIISHDESALLEISSVGY